MRTLNTEGLPWVAQNNALYSEKKQAVSVLSYRCKRTEKTIYVMRVIGTVEVPKRHAVEILMNITKRKEWDRSLVGWTPLETLTPTTDVVFMLYRSITMPTLRTVMDDEENDATICITATLKEPLVSIFAERIKELKAAAQIEYKDEDMTKRGSGFYVKAIDKTHTDITYLLQIEEGPIVDEVLNLAFSFTLITNITECPALDVPGSLEYLVACGRVLQDGKAALLAGHRRGVLSQRQQRGAAPCKAFKAQRVTLVHSWCINN